jgi:hypothetical protein
MELIGEMIRVRQNHILAPYLIVKVSKRSNDAGIDVRIFPLYDNLRFAKQVSENLAKMAVIGKYAWENTWIGLFGLFGGIQTAYYDRSQIEAALAWLNE